MVMGCISVQELPSVGRLASCRLLCSYVLMFLFTTHIRIFPLTLHFVHSVVPVLNASLIYNP